MYTKDPNCLGLVLEFCKNGDLKNLLAQTATHLTIEQKLLLLMDIAEVSEPFHVPFPKTFDNVASRFVSIALFNIGLPMNCLFDHYNDHTRLLVRTLGPMVLAVLLGVVFRIRAWASNLYERYILA